MPTEVHNLPAETFQRYAYDQKILDRSYIDESSLIAPHSEVNGTSSIFSSEWELLFETQKRNHSWAHFRSPLEYGAQPRKFFAYHVLPNVEISDEDEESAAALNLLKEHPGPGDLRTMHIFEREKNTLVNMFETLSYLNALLKHANTHKLRYQRG